MVVLASNPLKAAPIYSVIRGGESGRGYANVLIIASQVAECLLALAESAQQEAALRLL